MNLIVIDDSFEGNADLSTQNPAGLSVNIFKPSPDEFPAVKQVGDIVQFRHFKVTELLRVFLSVLKSFCFAF